jgi:uncharacterized membrane protein
MDNQMKETSNQQPDLKPRRVVKAALGIVFGAILGLIVGNMVGGLALGLIFGAGMGLIYGAALDQRDKKKI